jgi:tRNA 2-selenouridine synthase
LAKYLSLAPLIILETSTKDRIEITFDEYIVKAQKSYQEAYEEDFLEHWFENMHSAMLRIKRRLGGERYKIVCQIFDDAFSIQKKSTSLEKYKEWISYLLVEYYDPMYDYQIEKNRDRIIFRGSSEEIEVFLLRSLNHK